MYHQKKIGMNRLDIYNEESALCDNYVIKMKSRKIKNSRRGFRVKIQIRIHVYSKNVENARNRFESRGEQDGRRGGRVGGSSLRTGDRLLRARSTRRDVVAQVVDSLQDRLRSRLMNWR